jgi:ribosomal protein S18 acetylase RimI-like enzyme
MEIRADPWLAETMGQPVFRVEVGSDGPDPEALARHVQAQARAFYYAKVDTRQVPAVRHLARRGFAVVDTNVVFSRDGSPARPFSSPEVTVHDQPDASDHQGLLDIAGSAFRYTRFHLDDQVGVPMAGAIKREWVRSYLEGRRGDRLFVARLGGRPVGFLAALQASSSGRRAAVIDLIAVATEHQGRRVGTALTAAFIEHYRRSVDLLEVGTQVANAGSVRLYESMGFRLDRSQYVLHLQVDNGQPRG